MGSATSEPRLSDIAKHLILPEGITSTGWPRVRDRCKFFSLGFDRWQDGLGRGILAKRDSGLYAAGIEQASTLVICVRQQIET